jgi:hypothetical protein
MRRTLGLAATCGGALILCASPAVAQQLKTTEQAQSSSLGHAVAAPLRDVNLMRSKIPEILEAAYADPYRRPAEASCAGLIDEVTQLNTALGDDLDADNVKKVTLRGRAKEEALNAIAGLASDVIPFRGWVRKLSGAERHDKRVQQSIAAGAVRRAYLKGLGEARGCNPPATPLHKPLETEEPVEVKTEPVKPDKKTAPTVAQNDAPIVTRASYPPY